MCKAFGYARLEIWTEALCMLFTESNDGRITRSDRLLEIEVAHQAHTINQPSLTFVLKYNGTKMTILKKEIM